MEIRLKSQMQLKLRRAWIRFKETKEDKKKLKELRELKKEKSREKNTPQNNNSRGSLGTINSVSIDTSNDRDESIVAELSENL